MDVFYAYTYGSSLWLAIQAIPLTISPTIILALLSSEIKEPNAVEKYLSRSLGMALLTMGILTILLTGNVPLTTSFSDAAGKGIIKETEDPKAPYAMPTLTVTMLYHLAVAIFCYIQYNTSYNTAFILGTIGSSSLAIVGMWCILFASSNGRISRKTGADKRTSGFPFSNKNSAKAQSKQMKKNA